MFETQTGCTRHFWEVSSHLLIALLEHGLEQGWLHGKPIVEARKLGYDGPLIPKERKPDINLLNPYSNLWSLLSGRLQEG